MYRIIVFLIVLIPAFLCAQSGFRATAILGLNAAQIDGDSIYGFNKMGLTVGGRISYTTNTYYDIGLEMLYSQRGSSFQKFKTNEYADFNLNYFEIPIVFNLRDWHVEKDNYYKVRAEAGLSYGYLFSTKIASRYEKIGVQESVLRKHDVSWLLGAGINFTKLIGFSVRYTSPLFNLYNDSANKNPSLKSYFLTLRTEWNF